MSKVMREKDVAKGLLSIKAVFFRPDEPFTWASGIKSPVYCDNRLTLTAPEVRTLIEKPLVDVVKHYAKMTREAGLDGVVCSAQEAEGIHSVCGDDFVTVTPGIRFSDSQKGDQRRVMTPAEAKKIGSDYIVVGRPITQAEDVVSAYERCCREFIG